MSTFKVEVRKVGSLTQHPNADRLEIAHLEGLGFPIVVQKFVHTVGDLVVYFPLDSVLPDRLVTKFGLKSNRIRTMKLRGEISQGFCVPLSDLVGSDTDMFSEGDDLTDMLNVVKYEPPVICHGSAALHTLPLGVSIYDIEGCERHSDVVDLLMDVDVVITEKLEGSNFTIHHAGEVDVCSRRHTIKGEHFFWDAARGCKLDKAIENLYSYFDVPITLRGEIIGPGIQGNIYKLPNHQIRLFDYQINYKYQNWEALNFFHEQQLVPVLFTGKLRDYLAGRTVREASNGPSVLNPSALREGIVIKPLVERELERFGRLIIKQRSPEYLAKEK